MLTYKHGLVAFGESRSSNKQATINLKEKLNTTEELHRWDTIQDPIHDKEQKISSASSLPGNLFVW